MHPDRRPALLPGVGPVDLVLEGGPVDGEGRRGQPVLDRSNAEGLDRIGHPDGEHARRPADRLRRLVDPPVDDEYVDRGPGQLDLLEGQVLVVERLADRLDQRLARLRVRGPRRAAVAVRRPRIDRQRPLPEVLRHRGLVGIARDYDVQPERVAVHVVAAERDAGADAVLGPDVHRRLALEAGVGIALLARVGVGGDLRLQRQLVDRRPPLDAAEEPHVLAAEEAVERELAALAGFARAIAHRIRHGAERVLDGIHPREPSPAHAGGEGEVALHRLARDQVLRRVEAGAEDVPKAEGQRRLPARPLVEKLQLKVEAAVEQLPVAVPVVDVRIAQRARHPRQDLEVEVAPRRVPEGGEARSHLPVGLHHGARHVDDAGQAVEIDARPLNVLREGVAVGREHRSHCQQGNSRVQGSPRHPPTSSRPFGPFLRLCPIHEARAARMPAPISPRQAVFPTLWPTRPPRAPPRGRPDSPDRRARRRGRP